MRADLTGSDTCSATGISAHSSAPVLALCRLLIAAGHDPATRLEVFRGATLALTVRTIGEGVQMRLRGDGVGFGVGRTVGAASPMRDFEEAA